MKNIKFEEVQNLLDSGKQPEEMFDWVNDESDGFGVVKLNNKWNYLDENNKLLSDKWFDICYKFEEGFGKVILNGEACYINQNGELLYKNSIIKENIKFEDAQSLLDSGKAPKEVFDFVNIEFGGFREVRLNNKYNYIDENNKLLSPELWFDECGIFKNDFGLNKKLKDGEKYGYGRVRLNGKYNYIKPDGTLLSDTWFGLCEEFKGGFAVVYLNDKYNYINPDGKFLSPDFRFDSLHFQKPRDSSSFRFQFPRLSSPRFPLPFQALS